MTYAVGGPNWVELVYGDSLTFAGVPFTYANLLMLSDEQREVMGVKRILDDPPPPVPVLGFELIDEDGSPRRRWVTQEVTPVTPTTISRKQFAQHMAVMGVITEAEALAWVGRAELPALLEDAVESMPSEDRFPARMDLSVATFDRNHPRVAQLGAVLGYDDAQLDAIWAAASAL